MSHFFSWRLDVRSAFFKLNRVAILRLLRAQSDTSALASAVFWSDDKPHTVSADWQQSLDRVRRRLQHPPADPESTPAQRLLSRMIRLQEQRLNGLAATVEVLWPVPAKNPRQNLKTRRAHHLFFAIRRWLQRPLVELNVATGK